MDNAQFNELCTAIAYALQTEATLEDDDRCSLAIDQIDVLIDLDHEADALNCYIDLGDPSPHDRAQVCEQLLALNLSTHLNHHGAYAFEAQSGRAIFCANLQDATLQTGEAVADLLRYYIEETEYARQIVANPAMAEGGMPAYDSIFTGALA